jgi:predicted acetyltransferase
VTLALVEADPRLQQSYLAALDELAAEGNAHYLDLVVPPGPGFAGVAFTARSLAAPEVFAEFCRYTRALERPDTPRPADWVPGCYLWIVEDGEEVLGRNSLRHELTPWLLEVGGHIGYAVRPSARRRGVATAALGLMLEVAARHGIDPALVTCDTDNVGSRKVIEGNRGVLEDVRGAKMRFWVPTS